MQLVHVTACTSALDLPFIPITFKMSISEWNHSWRISTVTFFTELRYPSHNMNKILLLELVLAEIPSSKRTRFMSLCLLCRFHFYVHCFPRNMFSMWLDVLRLSHITWAIVHSYCYICQSRGIYFLFCIITKTAAMSILITMQFPKTAVFSHSRAMKVFFIDVRKVEIYFLSFYIVMLHILGKDASQHVILYASSTWRLIQCFRWQNECWQYYFVHISNKLSVDTCNFYHVFNLLHSKNINIYTYICSVLSSRPKPPSYSSHPFCIPKN